MKSQRLVLAVCLVWSLVSFARPVVPAPQSPQSVDWAGQYGGRVTTVAVQGTTAYVGVGPRLKVVSVSDPAQPVLVGESAPLANIIAGVAVSGTHAYVAGGTTLRVLDLSNPSLPVEVGVYTTTNAVRDVALLGDYAYITDRLLGLLVINISNPSAPTLTGSYDPGIYSYRVAVAGNYAYVTDTYDGRFTIINVSNPANPTFAGDYNHPMTTYTSGVVIVGTRAYITDGALRILDVSVPTSVVVLGTYGGSPTQGYISDVAVYGNYAYVFSDEGQPPASSNVMRVLDISNPANPQARGVYTGLLNLAHGVISGGRLFAADVNDGLKIINIDLPDAPVLQGHYRTVPPVSDLVSEGGYLYVADTVNGLHILRLPALDVVGRYFGPDNSYYEHLAYAGNYVYLLDPNYQRMQIVDVSDRSNPVARGVFTAPDWLRGVAVAGNYAYLAANQYFIVVDISNPDAPTQVGSATGGSGNMTAVALWGTRAFVTAGDYGVRIFDVSNPASPTGLGGYDPTSGYFQHLVLDGASGQYLYMLDGNGGSSQFIGLDVSTPSAPALLSNYNLGGSPSGIVTSGHLAFIGTFGNGLSVLDVSNPITPTLVSTHDTPGTGLQVSLWGTGVYLADGSGGLQVFTRSLPYRAFLPVQ